MDVIFVIGIDVDYCTNVQSLIYHYADVQTLVDDYAKVRCPNRISPIFPHPESKEIEQSNVLILQELG